jgi:hypothetical protein
MEDRHMAIEARLRELGARHQTLDKVIEAEFNRPAVDSLKLRALKRQKLKLKEQIEGLRKT